MILPTNPKAGLRPNASNWRSDPDKANTHCFYCRQPVPNHTPECNVPSRTVVLEMRIKFVASVPANWDTEMIEFHRNESSFCSSNDIKQIYEESIAKDRICTTCQRTEVIFVREATPEDHVNLDYIEKEEL